MFSRIVKVIIAVFMSALGGIAMGQDLSGWLKEQDTFITVNLNVAGDDSLEIAGYLNNELSTLGDVVLTDGNADIYLSVIVMCYDELKLCAFDVNVSSPLENTPLGRVIGTETKDSEVYLTRLFGNMVNDSYINIDNWLYCTDPANPEQYSRDIIGDFNSFVLKPERQDRQSHNHMVDSLRTQYGEFYIDTIMINTLGQ